MRRFGFASLVCSALAGISCSSENPAPNPPRDSGSEAGGGLSFTGKIDDLGNKGMAVSGATVTVGTQTATTDSTGAFGLNLPLNTPFNLTVTAPNYYKLTEQEALIKGNLDRGKTFLPSNTLGMTLNGALVGYEATLGGVGVQIIRQSTCADETGATFSWTVEGEAGGDAGTERIAYFTSGIPLATVKSAQKDQFPHALIYNVTPGKKITVSVTHPTCKQVPYPVDVVGPFTAGTDTTGGVGTITFTSGSILTEAGKATSFLRVFLK